MEKQDVKKLDENDFAQARKGLIRLWIVGFVLTAVHFLLMRFSPFPKQQMWALLFLMRLGASVFFSMASIGTVLYFVFKRKAAIKD